MQSLVGSSLVGSRMRWSETQFLIPQGTIHMGSQEEALMRSCISKLRTCWWSFHTLVSTSAISTTRSSLLPCGAGVIQVIVAQQHPTHLSSKSHVWDQHHCLGWAVPWVSLPKGSLWLRETASHQEARSSQCPSSAFKPETYRDCS